MANFKTTIITQKGHALIAKLEAGTATSNFKKICTSDYDYSSLSNSQLEKLTSIRDVKQTILPDKVSVINKSTVKVSGTLTNTELKTGYYIRTIALYAVDPDEGEILYSITPSTLSDFIPPNNGVTSSGVIIDLLTTVSNAENVSIDVDPNAIVSIQTFNDFKEEVNSQLDTIENIIKQDYSKIFNKIKATNFYVPYNIDEFGDYKTIIDNIKRVGNTHISFCIRLSMAEKTSNTITKGVSDDLVLQYVDYAISKGLKIIIKFHIGGAGGGGSANIQPTNTSLWIESLRDIALSYCDLLGDKIDIVCLSNECTLQTNQCYDDWKDYNDRVKAKNPKYITTTACTDVEMATTVLYDIVDVLGVNLYVGIGGDLNTPQYQRDKNMFVNYSDKENKIHELIYHANKHNKPFYITEVGCTPCVLALKYPNKWNYEEFVTNVEAQKVYYETFLKCFMNMEIIKGVSLWCANDGFTYFGNPAEDVVKKYFMEV